MSETTISTQEPSRFVRFSAKFLTRENLIQAGVALLVLSNSQVIGNPDVAYQLTALMVTAGLGLTARMVTIGVKDSIEPKERNQRNQILSVFIVTALTSIAHHHVDAHTLGNIVETVKSMVPKPSEKAIHSVTATALPLTPTPTIPPISTHIPGYTLGGVSNAIFLNQQLNQEAHNAHLLDVAKALGLGAISTGIIGFTMYKTDALKKASRLADKPVTISRRIFALLRRRQTEEKQAPNTGEQRDMLDDIREEFDRINSAPDSEAVNDAANNLSQVARRLEAYARSLMGENPPVQDIPSSQHKK